MCAMIRVDVFVILSLMDALSFATPPPPDKKSV